jgi:hypothetical protein
VEAVHWAPQVALGTKNREPGTELKEPGTKMKEPGTGTERTRTEKIGSLGTEMNQFFGSVPRLTERAMK